MRVYEEPAFVLHLKSYRETSALVDFFTLNQGRVSVVAHGVRSKKSRRPIQPFGLSNISYTGKSQLKTLTQLELTSHYWLEGQHLYAGIYLNELLVRLTGHEDPHPILFEGYSEAISGLAQRSELEPLLRRFELLLLRESGYGICFDMDVQTGAPIQQSEFYRFQPDVGFTRSNASGGKTYPGSILMAIGMGDYSKASTRRCAKHLMRQALRPHLGTKPLHSRSLFQQIREKFPV